MAEKVKKPNQGLAIAGLIINVVILPGLGSIIAGATTYGILQLVLFCVGIVLTITILGAIIGLPLMLGMWIWALITGIKLVKESS